MTKIAYLTSITKSEIGPYMLIHDFLNLSTNLVQLMYKGMKISEFGLMRWKVCRFCFVIGGEPSVVQGDFRYKNSDIYIYKLNVYKKRFCTIFLELNALNKTIINNK